MRKGVCLGALDTDFKTHGVHKGVSLQVANSHVGVRIKHGVDRELPGLQKNKTSQVACGSYYHVVSSRQVQRALNDLQVIYCDQ